jgi:hypothetical protein
MYKCKAQCGNMVIYLIDRILENDAQLEFSMSHEQDTWGPDHYHEFITTKPQSYLRIFCLFLPGRPEDHHSKASHHQSPTLDDTP